MTIPNALPHLALCSYLGHFTISGCENEVGFVQTSHPASAYLPELPADKNGLTSGEKYLVHFSLPVSDHTSFILL